MRQLTSIVLILVLFFCTSACAESLNFSDYSSEELRSLILDMRTELIRREGIAGKDTVIYNDNGIIIYLTGNYITNSTFGYHSVECAVVNNTGNTIRIELKSIYVNLWEAKDSLDGKYVCYSVDSGKKTKGNLTFDNRKADVSSSEDIEEIEVTMTVLDNSSKVVITIGPININFR